jgi:predicted permease
MLVCFIVLPVLFCLFMGLFGLVENLRHPALDWTSETQAVKSGVGVMITMFGSWGLIAVPVLPVVLGAGLSATAVAAAFTLVVALMCAALYRLLMSWGVRRFMSL